MLVRYCLARQSKIFMIKCEHRVITIVYVRKYNRYKQDSSEYFTTLFADPKQRLAVCYLPGILGTKFQLSEVPTCILQQWTGRGGHFFGRRRPILRPLLNHSFIRVVGWASCLAPTPPSNLRPVQTAKHPSPVRPRPSVRHLRLDPLSWPQSRHESAPPPARPEPRARR